MLLCVAAISVFGQGKTLYRINVVKPKAGMKAAFEESWKAHLDKFHQGDDKRVVYEVVSGNNIGSYVIIEGPIAYADMDNDKPNAREHSLDVDKNLATKTDPGGLNFTLRWADTLSYNAAESGDKVVINTTIVKDGKLGSYMKELRRSVLVLEKMKSPLSFTANVMQQAGTSPTIVTVRTLKNGFKELEQNFFQLPTGLFKDTYIKEYGEEEWDEREKIVVDDIVSREVHFEKRRADLSSR